MKKECKKFIKKIKRLNQGECLNFYDYEILCIIPKSSFMTIHDLDMVEMSYDEVIGFVQNRF